MTLFQKVCKTRTRQVLFRPNSGRTRCSHQHMHREHDQKLQVHVIPDLCVNFVREACCIVPCVKQRLVRSVGNSQFGQASMVRLNAGRVTC